jgi:multiple sugar transport system substrate-binding protein
MTKPLPRRTPASPQALRRRDFLRLSGGAAGLLVLPGLAACGDSGSGTGGGGGEGDGAPSLSWQAIPSYSIQAPDPARVEYVQEQISAFEGDSDATVDAQVSSSDIAAAMAQLLLAASEGRAPDVAQVDSYIFPRFLEHAVPVTDRLQEAGLALDDWFPPFREVMADGSDVKGLQFTTDVRVLYYRKDLVDAPPTTFDEVIEVARQLQQQDLQFFFPAGRGEGAAVTTVWPAYWAAGAEIVQDGQPGFADGAGRDALVEVLAFVQRCIREGITPQRVSTYGSEDDLNQEIIAGRAGMFLGGNWQVAQLQEVAAGGDFASQWGVAPIPNAGGTDFATTAGGWLWGFFSEDQQVRDAAAQFIMQGWVSNAGMAGWCNVGGYLPPRESVYDDPAYEGNAFTPQFREFLQNFARQRPDEESYPDISGAVQVALSNVASGQEEPAAAVDAALAALG